MADERDPIQVSLDGAVAHVRLDRPEKRNAFDDVVARELAAGVRRADEMEGARVIVLSGEGTTFCAGGDLAWMRRVADYDREQNLADAASFQDAFEALDATRLPVVARVQGAALGGGAGIVSACDIVVAESGATLGFPEVRLGLVPGVISPYVVRRIGEVQAKRLFITGERFDAEMAQRLGLVDEVAEMGGLDDAMDRVIGRILKGGAGAVPAAKALAKGVARAASHEEACRIAREAIADARASADGREGTTAFLERRKPGWVT